MGLNNYMFANLLQPTHVGAINDDCSQLGLRSGLRLGLRLGLSHSARPGTQLDRIRALGGLGALQGHLQLVIIAQLVLAGVLRTPSESFLHLLLEGERGRGHVFIITERPGGPRDRRW